MGSEKNRKKKTCICLVASKLTTCLSCVEKKQQNLLCWYLLVSKQKECQQVIRHAYLFVCLIKVNCNSTCLKFVPQG